MQIFKALRQSHLSLQKAVFYGIFDRITKSGEKPQPPQQGNRSYPQLNSQDQESMIQWKNRLQSQKFTPQNVQQSIQAYNIALDSIFSPNSLNKKSAYDKLLAKAIYEAEIPKDIATQYCQEVVFRYQSGRTNETTLTILEYILRAQLLDSVQKEQLKNQLMGCDQFKETIKRIITRSSTLSTFSTIVRLLAQLDYNNEDLDHSLQQEFHSKRRIFGQIDLMSPLAPMKQIQKTMQALKVISKYYSKENISGRFERFPIPINAFIYECSIDLLTHIDTYHREMKPENILLLNAIFFNSNLSIPDSQLSKILIRVLDKMADRFDSVVIGLILNFLVKVGSDTQLPLAKRFEVILIEKYEKQKQDYDVQSIVNFLRSGIYFELNKLLEFLVKKEFVLDILKQFQESPLEEQSLQNLFYQTMFKLPYFTNINFKIDFKNFNEITFQKEMNTEYRIEIDDICDYLSQMGIIFTREVIAGCYPVDLYVPNLTLNPSQSNCELKFATHELQEAFVKQTFNKDSYYIELDGKNHFYDKDQTTYSGSCLLKRKFLRNQMKLQVSVLKSKDLEIWNKVDGSQKSQALLQLIKQSI